MVKVFLQLYPMLPAESEEERGRLRPLGRSADLYQDALLGMDDIVRAAEDLGLWGVSAIEHHFHSEGYEVGPSPALLNARWAMITKRLRVGQLGFSMSAQSPIRVAEDAAIIDHMTQGRCFVGFSRGYQSRWTNILGQHFGAKATASPTGIRGEARLEAFPEKRATDIEDDRINRELFEEHVELVLRAWTEESLEHKGRNWQVPFPFDEGIEWPMAPTRHLGGHGEVDERGFIRKVSVVPSPYTKPHPPVFIASNTSPRTIEYAAERDFIPTYFTSVQRAAELGELYRTTAAAHGRTYALGQNLALARWTQIGDTVADAKRMVSDYDEEIFKNLYSQLTPMKYDPNDAAQSMMDSGLWAAGTIDDVRDHFVAQWKVLPAEYLMLVSHFAQQPKESEIKKLEMFMTHVKPALDEITDDAYRSTN